MMSEAIIQSFSQILFVSTMVGIILGVILALFYSKY